MRYSNGLKIIAGLASALFLYKTGKIFFVRRKYRHIPGPKTKGILGFYLGHLTENQRLLDEGKILADFFLECHEKYGDVFQFQFLDSIIVLTTNKEAVKEILVTKNYPKSPLISQMFGWPLNLRFLGDGLLTDKNYERWKKRRALFNPGFHKNVLMTFVNQFNVKTDLLMERLRTMADGKTVVDLFNEFNHVTLDAIALIAFGMNIDTISEKNTELNQTITGILKLITESVVDPLAAFKPWFKNKLKKLILHLRIIGKDKINERIQAIKNEDYIPSDILTKILQSWKDDEIDVEAMIDDFNTFFLAGQETTANALGFCFLELGRNPDIFKKAREEVDKIVGERTELSYQDAVDLKYCSAIFKEAMRVYPPVDAIDRKCTEEMEINGIKIPANTYITMSPYVSGRNPKFFENPTEFRPERFFKDPKSQSTDIENYTYYPFSLGARNCIGQNFAQIEGVMCIAKLIQKFDYKLEPSIDKSTRIPLIQYITLRPKKGTTCTITLRQ